MTPHMMVGETRPLDLSFDRDVDTATSYQIFAKAPSGATKTFTASLTSGTSRRITYTTLTSDIDEAGTWTLQGRAFSGSTVEARTRNVPMKVGANL